MAFRPDIIAGRAVILVSLQENLDKELRMMRTSLRRFANSLSDIGGDLFRFGAAGTLAGFFPVKEFMEFQDQMLFLQTKVRATDEQMKGLESTIRQLGRSTPFTSAEVAGAATEFAKAGFALDEITNSLQAALDLSRGGQVELSTATTILANSMRTFQVDTSRASEFASKFITAARLGTLDIVDLSESLKESSGTFRTLGIDINKALSLITQLSLSSLKATKAGTSLNTMMINLARRAEKLESFTGIEFTDDVLANPLKLLAVLESRLSRLSKAEQLAFLNQTTNIRGARALTSLLIQGLDNQQTILDKITASAGEARQAAEKLDSKLGGVFRRARSAFQEMRISIGATSEGPLTKFGEALRKALTQISEMAQKNPEFFQTLLLIPPAALAAGAGLLVFSVGLQRVASLITPVISLSNTLFSALTRVVGVNAAPLTAAFRGLRRLTAPRRVGRAEQRALERRERSLGRGGSKRSILRAIAPFSAALRGRDFSQPFIAAGRTGGRSLLRGLEFTMTDELPKRASVWSRLLQRRMTPSRFSPMSMIVGARNLRRGGAASLARRGASGLHSFLMQSPREVGKSLVDNLSSGLRSASSKIKQVGIRAGLAYQKGMLDAFHKGSSILNPLVTTSLGSNQGFLGSLMTKIAQVDFARPVKGGAKGILAGAGKGLGGALGGLRSVLKVDIVHGALRGFIGIGKALRGIFKVLMGIRRVFFSASGLLLGLELFLIFGDKVPVFGALFGTIRDSIKAFGNTLGLLATTAAPALETIRLGFSELFEGDLKEGSDTLRVGFKDLWAVFLEGVGKAVQAFKEEFKPISDKIAKVWEGLVKTFEAIKEIVEKIADVIVSSFPGSDGSINDRLGSFFSPENIEFAFEVFRVGLVKFGEKLIELTGFITQIISSLISATLGFLEKIPEKLGGPSLRDIKGLERGLPERQRKERELERAKEARRAGLRGGLSLDNPQIIKLSGEIGRLEMELARLPEGINSITAATEAAIDDLHNLMGNSTPNPRDNRPVFGPPNQSAADRAAENSAREEADKAARDRTARFQEMLGKRPKLELSKIGQKEEEGKSIIGTAAQRFRNDIGRRAGGTSIGGLGERIFSMAAGSIRTGGRFNMEEAQAEAERDKKIRDARRRVDDFDRGLRPGDANPRQDMFPIQPLRSSDRALASQKTSEEKVRMEESKIANTLKGAAGSLKDLELPSINDLAKGAGKGLGDLVGSASGLVASVLTDPGGALKKAVGGKQKELGNLAHAGSVVGSFASTRGQLAKGDPVQDRQLKQLEEINTKLDDKVVFG